MGNVLIISVSATHRETKQFYTLYNTLDDTKLYLEKEMSLLNSIYENYGNAMQSFNSREQFVQQFETIVEGIRTNKTKVRKDFINIENGTIQRFFYLCRSKRNATTNVPSVMA